MRLVRCHHYGRRAWWLHQRSSSVAPLLLLVVVLLLEVCQCPGGRVESVSLLLTENRLLNFFFNRRNAGERESSAFTEHREALDGCVERDGYHFKCTASGERVCQIGWTGDMCNVPICRPGCDPLHGYCHEPGECVCKLGWRGDLCQECMTLPGCIQGTCDAPWECTCKSGWDGLFCNQPRCKEGCHSTRGYCEKPDECKCRLGWDGEMCGQCRVLPGCKHGFCTRPLECRCHDGWSGIFCEIPICKRGCDPEHGYCEMQGVCRCKVGWTGDLCNECVPYPGCKHGTCRNPWECNCDDGWTGFLCDQTTSNKTAAEQNIVPQPSQPLSLDYCTKHPTLCLNGGECTSLPPEHGHYRCTCRRGFTGPRCQEAIIGKSSPSADQTLSNSTGSSNQQQEPPPVVIAAVPVHGHVMMASKVGTEMTNNTTDEPMQRDEVKPVQGHGINADEATTATSPSSSTTTTTLTPSVTTTMTMAASTSTPSAAITTTTMSTAATTTTKIPVQPPRPFRPSLGYTVTGVKFSHAGPPQTVYGFKPFSYQQENELLKTNG